MEPGHEKREKVAVVALAEENLTPGGIEDLKESLAELVRPNARIVLDLGKVHRMDSPGLGALLSFNRQMHAVGGNVKLASIPQKVRAIFQRMRIHRIFDIYNANEEAVRSFHL
jgi:anti-sigma B factor antagonist